MQATKQPQRLETSQSRAEALRFKTRLFALIVVLSNVAGDAALRKGMQQAGDTGFHPLAMITVLFHPWVAIGVVLLILWTLSQMTLLSWADLSYVVPVTAIGYVLNALTGRFWLGEAVSPTQWIGVCLISAGVVTAGYTSPSTTPHSSPLGRESNYP